MPVPPFVTVIVKPIVSPAETDGLSATFATSIAAPRTTTESDAVSEPSFVVETFAVLSTGEVVAVAADVPEVMWIVYDAPGARSEGPQVNVPPLIPQLVKPA